MNQQRFNGLRAQISIFFIIASLITALLMGWILYFSISATVLEDTLATTTMAVDKSGEHIEGYIDKIKDLSLVIANDASLKRYLKGEGTATDPSDVKQTIDTVLAADEAIASVIVVGKEGQLISNEDALDMSMSDDMMKEAWYVAVVNGDGMPSLTSARMQKFNMDKDRWVISLSREIIDEEGNHLGVVVVDFRYSILEKYLENLDLGNEGYVYILGGDGGVVYHPNTEFFENNEKQRQLRSMSTIASGYDGDMNLLLHTCTIGGTDWQMYGVASLDGLNAIRRQLIETIVLIAIISLGAMIFLSTFLAGTITNPIKALEGAMESIEQEGDWMPVEEHGCNEAVSLAKHYNYMIQRVQALMSDIAQKEQSLRSYELNVLHSQINPHFLYNTLDTIVWMAEFGDSERVIYITKALAKFFRLSLSGGSQSTTLGDEVDHVRQYLMIQKERYGDRLNYAISEQEDLKATAVPKLLLQPIVENSIYHGIRDLERPGHIKITVGSIGSDILLTVTDDGLGFDVHAVPAERNEEDVRLGGVGIGNVDRRLKLIYGDAYGLEIESQPGKGTRVVLKLKGMTTN